MRDDWEPAQHVVVCGGGPAGSGSARKGWQPGALPPVDEILQTCELLRFLG
jgi:hypothetical protein